jgi:hypothetical protein
MRKGSKWVVVMDGKEGKEYERVMQDSLVFSPDSKHLAYIAQSNWKYFVVVDGVEGDQYSRNVHGSRLIFDSPTHLHGLMQHRGQFVKIDIDILQ